MTDEEWQEFIRYASKRWVWTPERISAEKFEEWKRIRKQVKKVLAKV